MAKDPFAPRPTDKPQLTRDDLKTMHHLDIAQAQKEGRLDEITNTGRRVPPQGKDFHAIVEAGKAS